ncbi:uncharacterized protein BDZ83DRAFT_731961 [Colletotrichum acutatum]|uniref:Uncharacterized protein n=1 Tax=Glomerella acutata TaxID=27357 RepID=A0AAD8UGB4_GLOAC|nr:uncharacterized protein BDZ83DRAFT_731961 [Colletotrichum acutatum]KAK1723366.1 hypothetical protein BDZ83DRAFT_731961 [Colletotrichum acutatum]
MHCPNESVFNADAYESALWTDADGHTIPHIFAQAFIKLSARHSQSQTSLSEDSEPCFHSPKFEQAHPRPVLSSVVMVHLSSPQPLFTRDAAYAAPTLPHRGSPCIPCTSSRKLFWVFRDPGPLTLTSTVDFECFDRFQTHQSKWAMCFTYTVPKR